MQQYYHCTKHHYCYCDRIYCKCLADIALAVMDSTHDTMYRALICSLVSDIHHTRPDNDDCYHSSHIDINRGSCRYCKYNKEPNFVNSQLMLSKDDHGIL